MAKSSKTKNGSNDGKGGESTTTSPNADKADAAKPSVAKPFEQSLSELEQTVQALEKGTLGLEESLEAFENAMGLLRVCYASLDNAQRRVELVKDLNQDGSPVTEPMDDEELDLATKQQNRSRRRSAN